MKYLRRPMPTSRAKLHKASLLHQISSRDFLLQSWDTDDPVFMSTTVSPPSTRLFLQIPTDIHNRSPRPTLQDVLSNVAPAPWTLSAFMAYLSHNHCLETLEFTSDAAKYEAQYRIMLGGPSTSPKPSSSSEYMRMQWLKLIDTYIRPNGPREVNLPYDVRDHLLSLPCAPISPDPTELGSAVRIIHELMEESILGPFINAVSQIPTRPTHDHLYSWFPQRSTSDSYPSEERSPSRSQYQWNSGSSSSSEKRSPAMSSVSPRQSNQGHFPAFNNGRATTTCRLSAFIRSISLTPVSPQSYCTSENESATSLELVTPPNTSPTSNISPHATSSSSSLLSSETCYWKKMSVKFGWKRSHSTGSQSVGCTYPLLPQSGCGTP